MSTSSQDLSEGQSSPPCISISSEDTSFQVERLPTRKKDQERLLRVCNTRFHDLLNLKGLFPHLVQERLLTRHEIEGLQSLSPVFPDDDAKIDYLLKILPTKGQDALRRFVRCLHQTEDGTAHDELIRFMIEACSHPDGEGSGGIDNSSGSIAGHSGSVSWMFVVASILTGLILAQCFGVVDIVTQLRYQLNIVQSRSLPYPSKTFVGRQQELKELTKVITFSKDNFRIVNVVGAPGIGKSTLAIHVGHKMIAAGVAVHYVNIAEFPDEQVLQVLAEKILESAEIVTDTVGNFNRLLKWARNSYWNNLLILDNCDDALNYQKEEFQRGIERIVQESMNIKVLMTSREISLHLDHLKQLKVYELTLESACDLLIEKVPVEVNLTSEKRETIANLTGKIPLALQIIASLLTLPSPPSPEEIIQELNKHPIETLSHDKLPQNRKVNASFSLSYNYLTKELQIIGSYVANFPGSFTKEAAIYSCGHLIHGKNQRDIIAGALRSLVDRSLLEHSTRMDRFHYHRLIREFFHFRTINQNSSSESFLSGFYWHYSKKLYEFAIKFNVNHKPSLAFLDTERHNIQLLLDNLAMQKINERDEFIKVITAVAAALDFDLLNCRFSGEELLAPLHGALIHLDQHIKMYTAQLSLKLRKLDCDYEQQITYTAHRMVCTYETLIHNVAEIENQIHGPMMALQVYDDRKGIMEDIKQPWNMGTYIEFLRRFAHYYQILGYKDEEIECHKRIIDHSLKLTEIFCKKETECKYVHVAKMYASLSNDREAAHFYGLSLSKEHHSVMHKAEILCELCKIYERLYLNDKAKEFFENLISLHSEIMNAPPSQFFRYSNVVWNVVHVYTQHQKHHEAAMLQEKMLESLSDIGTIPDKQTLMTGIDAVRRMFHSRNYKKSIQIGQQILELLAREKELKDVYYNVTIQEIKILIGRAKVHSGDFSVGLDELETAYMNLTFTSKLYNRDKICKYLIFRPLKYFDLCTELNLGPYTIIVFGQTLLYLLFVPPLAIGSKQIALHFFAKPEQHFVTSTELTTVRSELEIWDFFIQIQQLRTYIEELIYGYVFGIIEFCMKSVLFCLVINIASILFRLWILYMLCKLVLKLSRFANQHRCACFFFIISPSLCLCSFLGAIAPLLYLSYLVR